MFEMPLCRMSHHVKGIWKIFRVMFYCAAIHRTNSRQCYCKYHRRNMALVYITFARCRSWILSVPLAFIASIKNLVNHFSSTSINVHDNNNAGKEEEEKKEQKTNTLQQLQNDREREKNAKELKQWMWSNANAYLFQSQVTIAIFFPLSKQSNVVIIFLLLCLYLCNLISYTHTNTQLTQLINLVLRLICVHDMYSTYLERLHLPRIETVEIEAEAEKNKLIYLISRFYRYLVQILSLSHFLSISKREGKSTSFALFSPLALVGWQSILRNSILNRLWAGKKTVQFFFCCRPREEKKNNVETKSSIMAYALRLGQGVQRACYLAFFNGKTGGTWRSRMTFNRQHAYCNIATILLKEIRTERPMCVCVCVFRG